MQEKGNKIFTEGEVKFLRELIRQKVPFMLVGLSAATLQGAPVVTQDIDLWFKDPAHRGIKQALDRVGGVYVPPSAFTPPMFAGESVRLFDIVVYMHGLGSFADERRHAIKVKVDGFSVPVLSLSRIIDSKKALNRLKDQQVLPVLEDVLKAQAIVRKKRRGV